MEIKEEEQPCSTATVVETRPYKSLRPLGLARKPSSRGCGLVQCRKADCNLISHHHYAASKRHVPSRLRVLIEEGGLTAIRLPPTDGILEQSVSRIQHLLANGFSATSFQLESSSVFKELTHHYFTALTPRLIKIHSPQYDPRKYKSTMVDFALSNDVFCLCMAANAKTDMLMRGHCRKPDRGSEIVYATTAHILRHKLDNFRPNDVDWLLVLVVALVGFDLVFGRTNTLANHHAALKQLIEMRGGIHMVGHVRPYVVSTDRFLALFTGQYPILRQTPVLPTSPRYGQPPTPYGAAFGRPKTRKWIDRPVLDFCLGHCQLIHLMESSRILFKADDPPTSDPSVLPYFLYFRDHLLCQGTCLYADYHENRHKQEAIDGNVDDKSHVSDVRSKSRCILLATMMIEYIVAHANYYTVKAPFLADQLKSVLDHQDVGEWTNEEDMLTWILFVLASIPEEWDHHHWALKRLKQQFDSKYGGQWPKAGWRDEQLALLRNHIWAESLDASFRHTCLELVSNQ